MRRRRLLAVFGSSLSIAGCVGFESPGTPTADETTTTGSEDATTVTFGRTTDPELLALGESFETADGQSVAVHDVQVQRIVFTQGVHTDPRTRPDEQFVVADVAVSDRDIHRDLSVVADGRTVAIGANDALVSPFDDPVGELLGFRVPAPLDAERGAVVWSGDDGATARWSLDADLLDALANPPEFAVEAFEVPEEVERGSSFTATLTVSNSGSGGGAFRAELGATTISDTPEIRVAVPASETVTAEQVVEPYYPDDADEATIRLNWDAEFVERTVSIV